MRQTPLIDVEHRCENHVMGPDAVLSPTRGPQYQACRRPDLLADGHAMTAYLVDAGGNAPTALVITVRDPEVGARRVNIAPSAQHSADVKLPNQEIAARSSVFQPPGRVHEAVFSNRPQQNRSVCSKRASSAAHGNSR